MIADGMARHLGAAGFDPIVVGRGELGLARLRFENPDVCVLDLMLPELDGWKLIETARAEGIGTPIVVVSARGTEHDRVHALEIGADDYLVKPFSMRELVARVGAAARRGVRPAEERRGEAIEIEELRIDPREVQAFVDGESAGLTPTEFRLLYTLALDRGRVVTRDELLQKVWGRRETHRDRTVDVFVRRLRQKIDRPAPQHSFIQTRFGVGYKLEPEPKSGALPIGRDSLPAVDFELTAGAARDPGASPASSRRPRSSRTRPSGIAPTGSRASCCGAGRARAAGRLRARRSYGGAGADFLSYILVLEELSRADAGVGVTVAVHTSACTLPLLAVRHRRAARAVRAAARARRAGRLLRADRARRGLGRRRARDARRARRRRLARARREAVDHERRVRRHVARCSRAPIRRRVGARRLGVRRSTPSTSTVTRTEEKLGLNSSVTNDIAIDAVVDDDRLLGDEDHGFRIAMATLDGGRIGIAAQAVGIAQAALRRRAPLRAGAARVRPAGSPSSRRSSTSSRTCRWRSTRRGCSRYRAAWLKDERPPAHRGRREGEAVRLRDGAPPDRRGDPGARRLRLHEGVPGRALLPRREDHGDLRGHERDPAPRDRARRSSAERHAGCAA